MTRRLVLAAVLVTVYGCGHISATAFVDRGNTICATTAARIARLAKPPGMHHQVAAAGGYVDAYAAETRQELTMLRALGYPPGKRSALERIYRGLDRALAAAQRDPLHFRPAALSSMAAGLQGYGLTACRF